METVEELIKFLKGYDLNSKIYWAHEDGEAHIIEGRETFNAETEKHTVFLQSSDYVRMEVQLP